MAFAPDREARKGFLTDCLVDSDPVLERRARRVKQRALLISILLQILIVAALVLMPLLSRGENIAARVVVTPTVPYAPGGGPSHPRNTSQPRGNHPIPCRVCPPSFIPPTIATTDNKQIVEDGEPVGPGIPGVPPGVGVPGGAAPVNERHEPPPPEDPSTKIRKSLVKISEGVQSAMLVRRVQPAYPALAIQLHREGRVELHAIIATDGSIQSLQVISGDPLLIQSALAAVREWHYRPTILNGQAVEVDTHITVIYTLSHQ
jgi:periplasmic protein TonB